MNPTTKVPAIKRGWLRALLIIIPFFIVSGIFQFLALVLYGAITGNLNLESLQNADMSGGTGLVMQLSGTLGTLLIVWIFSRYIDRIKFKDLGFSLKNQKKNIFYGLFAGLIMMGLGTLLLWGNGNLTIDSVNLGLLSLLQSIVLFILVSVNEEVFVRGYILPNLMDSMNKYIALVVSSLIFTALHLFNPNVSVIGVTNIFLAGILLGISYIFTKNLWFPITLHFSWNFFQGPIFGFEVSGTSSETLISQTINGNDLLTGGQFGFEGSIIATVLCSLGIVLFWMVYKNQDIISTENN
jgi:membrane protease YdiL (CAAX protease family)